MSSAPAKNRAVRRATGAVLTVNGLEGAVLFHVVIAVVVLLRLFQVVVLVSALVGTALDKRRRRRAAVTTLPVARVISTHRRDDA